VFRRASAFALAFALVCSSGPVLGQQSALTILSKDSQRAIATTTANGQEYVGLDDLAGVFQLTVREDQIGMLAVTYKGKTILLTPNQPLGSVAGRVFSLPAPTIRSNGRWLVPVDFIGRALALVYDTKIALRRPSQLVIVGDLRVPRVQIRYEGTSTGSSGRLTVDATPRAASTVTQEGDQLLVTFDADAVDVVNPGAALTDAAAQGLIQRVRTADPAALAFTTGPRFGTFRVTSQASDTSTRQTIDIAAAGAAPSPGARQPPAVLAPPPELLTPAGNGSWLRTVVVDPGHGGDDPGAQGPEGTTEKDVTLAAARKLKTALEARLGVRVLLTRDDDRNVALEDRTAVANNSKADLFISLHANASWRPALAGATILTALIEHLAEQTARSLPPELVPAATGGARNIEFVPWDVAQIPHLEQSAALARVLVEQLRDRVPLAATPIMAAPLRVLEPANMPAVLIEMGYLTNAGQETQLADPDFQSTLTQALVDAVVKFRDALGAPR